MNRMKDLANLFGLELDEPFVFVGKYCDETIRYKFTENGLMVKPSRQKWGRNPFAFPILEIALIYSEKVSIKKLRRNRKDSKQ